MYKFAFALIALSVSIFATKSQAQSPCFGEGSISCTFNPGTNVSNTYDFGTDGKLKVTFDVVLKQFTLSVNTANPTDPLPLDPGTFPPNTVCVKYDTHPTDCVRYDFSGSSTGPHGVPVKGVDYKFMITLQLGYLSGETHIPAFGHAPGDITTFTEDILTGYFEPPHCVDSCITFAPATAAPTTAPTTKASAASAAADPTMIGKVPGLSSIIALDEQLTEQDIMCRITLSPPPPYSQAINKEIELTFQLFAGNSCPAIGTGTPLRDKTARFSLSYADSAGNIFFPPIVDQEEGNKFHWENKKGLNEFDFGTKGLPTTPQAVTYTITIFSSKASPNGTTFILNP